MSKEKNIIKAINKLKNEIAYEEKLKNAGNYNNKKYSEEVIKLDRIAIKALEKQLPKKPIEDEEQKIRYITTYICPHCKNKFTGVISTCCYHCGQKFDWSK